METKSQTRTQIWLFCEGARRGAADVQLRVHHCHVQSLAQKVFIISMISIYPQSWLDLSNARVDILNISITFRYAKCRQTCKKKLTYLQCRSYCSTNNKWFKKCHFMWELMCLLVTLTVGHEENSFYFKPNYHWSQCLISSVLFFLLKPKTKISVSSERTFQNGPSLNFQLWISVY